jgi:ABC-2 type transport system ATP-binding protein
MVAGLLRPDAGSVSVLGIDALADPVAAKQITAWVSDEPMIYDKLTPLEYLEFVADCGASIPIFRTVGAPSAGLARPGTASARALRGFSEGHAPEGGAGGRWCTTPLDHPGRTSPASTRYRRATSRRLLGDRVRSGCTVIMTTHILKWPNAWPTGSARHRRAAAGWSPKARWPSCAGRTATTTPA